MNYHLPFIVSLRFLKRVQSNLIGLSKSVTFLIHNQSSIDQRFWWQSPNDLVWNLVGIKLQLERQSCQLGKSVLLILWDSQSNLKAQIWSLIFFIGFNVLSNDFAMFASIASWHLKQIIKCLVLPWRHSCEKVFHKYKCIHFIAPVPSACGKLFPKIVPKAKLHSLLAVHL